MTTTLDHAKSAPIVRWRLHPTVRKLLLITHIASAGGWLGMDLVLGVLVIAGVGVDESVASAYAAAIAAFVGWPIVVLALLALVSGFLLALGSKYGVVRTWWVLVKLGITLILIALTVLVLVPNVAALSAAVAEPGFAFDERTIFPPVVSSSALLFAMVLSVLKPWGRVRAQRPV